MPASGRFHALIFSLLYPAFLGTFIVSVLSEPLSEVPPWGLLLTVYFSMQFVEGYRAGNRFVVSRAIMHLIEIGLMVAAFSAMGYFGSTVKNILPSYEATPLLLALIFVVPVLHRLFFEKTKPLCKGNHRRFHWSLTLMSLAAALSASCLRTSWWGWGFVAAILATYIVAFQFFNDKIFREGSSFRRPSEE